PVGRRVGGGGQWPSPQAGTQIFLAAQKNQGDTCVGLGIIRLQFQNFVEQGVRLVVITSGKADVGEVHVGAGVIRRRFNGGQQVADGVLEIPIVQADSPQQIQSTGVGGNLPGHFLREHLCL